MRALWYGVIPVLLTAVTWRYLVPRPAALDEGALRDLASFCDQHQSLAWPGLFLFYSYVARHWRGFLPGASHWSEPPARPAVEHAQHRARARSGGARGRCRVARANVAVPDLSSAERLDAAQPAPR